MGKGRLTHPQVLPPTPVNNSEEIYEGGKAQLEKPAILFRRPLPGVRPSLTPELKPSGKQGPEQSTLLSWWSSATLRDKVKFAKTLSNDNLKPDEEATKLLYCYSCSEFKDEQASTHPAGRPRGQEVRVNGGAHCLALGQGPQ